MEAGIDGYISKSRLLFLSISFLLLKIIIDIWCYYLHAHKHDGSDAAIEMCRCKLLPGSWCHQMWIEMLIAFAIEIAITFQLF
jgi:hypothetical protein